jgi:hypothetical protein
MGSSSFAEWGDMRNISIRSSPDVQALQPDLPILAGANQQPNRQETKCRHSKTRSP